MKTAQKILADSTKSVLQQLILLCMYFTAGFLFSRTVVFAFAPIGVALISAVPVFAILPAALGAAVGTVSMIGKVSLVKYLLAAFISSSARLIYRSMKGENRYFPLFTSFLSVALSSFLVQLYDGFNATVFIFSVFEAAFCAALTYFFGTAISALSDTLTVTCLNFRQITSVVVAMAVTITALSGITVFDISIARIIAVTLILSASVYGREQAGAIAGTSFGAALALFDPKMLFLCGGYAMGGLFSGVFSRTGQTVSAIVFAATNGLFALLSGDKNIAVIVCYEVLFATVLFLVLPRGVKKQLSAFFSPKVETLDLSHSQRMLSKRLQKASVALNEMSGIINKVSDILKGSNEEFETVFERVRVTACRGCALCNYCWEMEKSQTLSELISATKFIKSGESEIFNEEFVSRCTRKNSVERALSAAFYDYITRENTRQHVGDVQTAMKLQFESVSALLDQLSSEMLTTENFDKDTSDTVEAVLKGMSLHPKDISSRIEKSGRMTVEITVTDSVIPQKKLAEKLSLSCDRELETTEVERRDGLTYISLSDKAVYSVDFAARQHTNKGYSVCGDAYNKLNTSKGTFSMFISDGMGSGTRAAVEGTMTVGLMSRLVKSGFDYSAALGLVNSALLFKSDDESLATLDISAVDLYSGQVNFYKAGTPPTFVRRNGLVGSVGCAAMPIGILSDITFEEAECTLSRGDIIVMVSDGATDNGSDWIKGEIKQFDGKAYELADTILKTAVSRFNGHEDDITVLVAIIK